MIQRIPANNLSSLWKREAGRDFWEGRFTPLTFYSMRNDPEGSSVYTQTTHTDVGVLKPFIKEFDFFPFSLEGDGIHQFPGCGGDSRKAPAR